MSVVKRRPTTWLISRCSIPSLVFGPAFTTPPIDSVERRRHERSDCYPERSHGAARSRPGACVSVQPRSRRHVPERRREGQSGRAGLRLHGLAPTRPRGVHRPHAPCAVVRPGVEDRDPVRRDARFSSSAHPRDVPDRRRDAGRINRTRENHTGHGSPQTLPTIRLRADNDRDRLDLLVAAFNGLYGAVADTVSSCPVRSQATTYRITFHTERGEVTYQWTDTYCDAQIEVTRDGTSISPDLDPSNLQDILTKVLAD